MNAKRNIDAPWYKSHWKLGIVAIVVTIIFGIPTYIALFKPQKVIIPESPSEIDSALITFEEYYKKLNALSDRFLEKEEFIKKLQGKQVNWIGYVERVFTYPDGSIGVMFEENKDKFILLDSACVDFTKNWKPKLFSLRKGDKIKVKGIFKKQALGASLKGISLELLN